MRRAIVVLVCLPLLLTGCTDEAEPEPEPDGVATPRPTEPEEKAEFERKGLELAPPVTLDLGGEQVDLHPWTSCYQNGCADGFPPPDPYDVGDRDEVRFTYPLEDWRFSAQFREVTDGRCGRAFQAPVERTGDGSWVITPTGYAGTYDVDVSGRGNGDVHTTFRWTTERAGELPTPSASLSPVHDGKGEIRHWGVTLYVADLADLDEPVVGTVTVSAANGRSMTFERQMSYGACTTGGGASFDTRNKEGRALAKIGPAPYSYEVALVLDGTAHTASVLWPSEDVVRRGNIELTFDPPLPALD